MIKPAANRRLAQWRVTWLIGHSTSHQLLWCIDSFVLRNPPLRQAPKRYGSAAKKYAQHKAPAQDELQQNPARLRTQKRAAANAARQPRRTEEKEPAPPERT